MFSVSIFHSRYIYCGLITHTQSHSCASIITCLPNFSLTSQLITLSSACRYCFRHIINSLAIAVVDTTSYICICFPGIQWKILHFNHLLNETKLCRILKLWRIFDRHLLRDVFLNRHKQKLSGKEKPKHVSMCCVCTFCWFWCFNLWFECLQYDSSSNQYWINNWISRDSSWSDIDLHS